MFITLVFLRLLYQETEDSKYLVSDGADPYQALPRLADPKSNSALPEGSPEIDTSMISQLPDDHMSAASAASLGLQSNVSGPF